MQKQSAVGQPLNTVWLRGKVERCEDIDELKAQIFPLHQTQKEQWMRKINLVVQESGCTKTAFASACHVSRVSVDKWCKGALPKSRETFIRIGLAGRCDIEGVNRLLQRYGQYPALYSKTLEDCVAIYVLSHGGVYQAAEQYDYILKRMRNSRNE